MVGHFDAAGTSFDSEMWTDADYLGLAQKRDSYSSVTLRPVGRSGARAIADAIRADIGFSRRAAMSDEQ